ncbi:MAG: hypothetical protein GEU88_04110 [Solirubrobacterales bacterium]|nr:hypothetical protein [Solirubrobacterales bacterium]
MPRPRPSSRPRALAATAACVAALGLAACGGDDEDGTTTTTGTEAADTTTTTTGESTSTTSTTESTTSTPETADVDALRDQFNEQLHQVLTEQQGLTASQADCAVDELQDSLTDDALQQVAETGKPPEGLIDAAFEAGATCKDE